MQIKPILAAMRHHRAGTVLIALQIALTLAIVLMHCSSSSSAWHDCRAPVVWMNPTCL